MDVYVVLEGDENYTDIVGVYQSLGHARQVCDGRSLSRPMGVYRCEVLTEPVEGRAIEDEPAAASVRD
jgi:hypothetical protein